MVCDNMALSQHDIARLKDSGIACTTDDYKYQYTSEDGQYGKTGHMGRACVTAGGGLFEEKGWEPQCGVINSVVFLFGEPIFFY